MRKEKEQPAKQTDEELVAQQLVDKTCDVGRPAEAINVHKGQPTSSSMEAELSAKGFMDDNARRREALMRGQYSSSDIAKLESLHKQAYQVPALARHFALPPQLSQQQAEWLPDGYKLLNATRRTSITDRQSNFPRQYDVHGVELPPSRLSLGKFGDSTNGRMNGTMKGNVHGNMNGSGSPRSSPALPNTIPFHGGPRPLSRGGTNSSILGNMNSAMKGNMQGDMSGNGSSRNSPALPNAIPFSGGPRPMSWGANTSSIQGNISGNINGSSGPHSSPNLPNAMPFNADPLTLSRGAKTVPHRQPTIQDFRNSQNPRQGPNGQVLYGIRQVPNMIPVQANRPRAPPAQMVAPSANGAQQLSRPPSANGLQQSPRVPSANGQKRFDGNPDADR